MKLVLHLSIQTLVGIIRWGYLDLLQAVSCWCCVTCSFLYNKDTDLSKTVVVSFGACLDLI